MAKRIRKNGMAMVGRVPVLKYKEIGDIMCLEHRTHLNGVVVDDAATNEARYWIDEKEYNISDIDAFYDYLVEKAKEADDKTEESL